MARPRKEIDDDEVARMAFEGASNREIAAILGCDDKTIANRFSAILAKKRAERRVNLRRAQNAAAESGNAALLIWLGKQELEQADRVAPQPVAPVAPRLTIPDADERPAPQHEG